MFNKLFTIVIGICFFVSTNAQIKLVGEDYRDSLTGAKNYYDRDVDFEKIFPAISSKDYYGFRGPCFINRFKDDLYDGAGVHINRVGDTVYFIKNIDLSEVNRRCNRIFGSSEKCGHAFSYVKNGDSISENIPSGYYVVIGYSFCSEETKRIEQQSGFQRWQELCIESSKRLKERIVIKDERLDILGVDILNGFRGYVIFRQLNENDTVNSLTAYMDIDNCFFVPYSYWSGSDIYRKIIDVGFYNEIKKLFVGEKVTITYGFDRIIEVPFDSLMRDCLRNEVFKLHDQVFIFKDIVLKNDGIIYAILEGKNTGSFAVEIQGIKYLYNISINGNSELCEPYIKGVLGTNDINHSIKDIAALLMSNGKKKFWLLRENDINVLKKRAKISESQRKQEFNLRIKEEKRKKISQENEFKNKMIAKYGAEFGTSVGDHKVSIGMSQDMCCDAWGRPMNTYRTTTKYGQSEVWCYNYKTRIYFYNGKVVQIDN